MGRDTAMNVAVLGMRRFIATLAMTLVAGGLALVLSNSTPIYFNDVPGYTDLSTGNLIPNVPNAVLILLLIAIIAGVLLIKSVLGRYTYSIGSNEEATALSGIDVRRWKIVIYAF